MVKKQQRGGKVTPEQKLLRLIMTTGLDKAYSISKKHLKIKINEL